MSRRPPNRGEQETLEQKAQRLDQETVQHLKMAAAINHETVELGTATLAELKTQGETLNRTAAKLDHLNAKADEAEHTLRGMSSIWATMKNKLFRKKPKNAEVVTITKSVERDLEQKQERSEFRRTEKQIRQEQAQEDAQRRVNQTPSSSSVLNEQDQLLEEISKSVMRLGEISREAGHELDMQAKVLDQIHESSERANVKLKANTKAAKILAS